MDTRKPLLTTLLLLVFSTLGESYAGNSNPRFPSLKQAGRKGTLKCPVDLPQRYTKNCKNLLERELKSQRGIYQLAIKPPLPMPLVNMTIKQLRDHHTGDNFAREHFVNYFNMLMKTRELGANWITQHPEEITDYQEYKNIFKEFRSSMANMSNKANENSDFYRFVSNHEPFRDILKDWRDDCIFADLRLSGINPMVLRRVTDDSSDVGLKWSELKKTLNTKFNWKAAIQAAMGKNVPLKKAIKKDYVYVLRYEVFDDMISFPDKADDCANRHMWPEKSPVALFAVNKNRRLRPVAIQIDYKPDSHVVSPADGDSWMFAKMVVQATDYLHSQMIEHLLKTHLLVEPFCVVLHRQLSFKHPLHVILKYHCRGVMVANTLGAPQLITPGTFMDKLSAMGYKGTLLLVERGYQTLSWKDADCYLDIKKRGLDNKKVLRYFPYRDDSILLFKTIKKMVKEYISIYYRRDDDVKKDYELQAFMNELSAKGTGPDGGNGQIRDFPPSLNTKRGVINMITQLIWLMSVKHAAVDFPMGDYGAFTPLDPTKVYTRNNDSSVPPENFSISNLPHVNVSVAQMQVAMNVGTYHYDTLFDYYEQLSDPYASELVRFYYHHLNFIVKRKLKARNKRRFKNGYLTYPYLEPYWLPNGIQT